MDAMNKFKWTKKEGLAFNKLVLSLPVNVRCSKTDHAEWSIQGMTALTSRYRKTISSRAFGVWSFFHFSAWKCLSRAAPELRGPEQLTQHQELVAVILSCSVIMVSRDLSLTFHVQVKDIYGV